MNKNFQEIYNKSIEIEWAKRERKKTQPIKKQNNLENEIYEKDNKHVDKTQKNESDINQILDNQKKKSTKRKSRQIQSSAKIDVVNLNSKENKVKTKKTGWWNN